MSGYSVICLMDAKNPANIGAAFRAAGVFGAAAVVLAGDRPARVVNLATDTMAAWKRLPIYLCNGPFDAVPAECTTVAVEVVPGATMLPVFRHPDRAYYIFGPEDGSLPREVLDRCMHTVQIPATACLNLAAAVNVTMYDRASKRYRSGGLEHAGLRLGKVGTDA